MNMLARIAVLALLALAPLAAPAAPHLEILAGVTDAGSATPLWQAMIRQRLPAGTFSELEHLQKPLTVEELAWVALIESRRAEWKSEIPALATVFHPINAPRARIVLGNRGGDDAFTHDPHTIGFDLERLHALYGSADDPANAARIDRFFRHEYTHLLQKAWFRLHPVALESPLDLALAEIFTEGMGNYHSLSKKWRNSDGSLSAHAVKTLRALEPRFLARLAAIACATPEHAARLSTDLSRGRFDRKWGALTIALWLANETGDNVLRDYLLAGPEGTWALAERQLPEALRPLLDEIRQSAALCDAS